jgi:hypothetical protein
MFEEEPEDEKPTDYTGLIIGAILLPVFLLFRYFGRVNLALSACVCLGAILIVIRIRWELRKRTWFWATIVLVLLLHVPVILLVPWPHMTVNRITLLPIGFADFLIVLGAVKFVERFIVKYVPPDEDDA